MSYLISYRFPCLNLLWPFLSHPHKLPHQWYSIFVTCNIILYCYYKSFLHSTSKKHPSIHLLIHLLIHPSIYLSIPSIHPSINVSHSSIHIFIYPIHLSIHSSIYSSTNPIYSFTHPSIYTSILLYHFSIPFFFPPSVSQVVTGGGKQEQWHVSESHLWDDKGYSATVRGFPSFSIRPT